MSIHRLLKTTVAAATLAAALSTGSAYAATRVYVRVGPPAPIVETRVVAPGPGHVWVGGYHTWNGHAYVWVPGTWNRAPRPHAHWVPARWVHNSHGYYMVSGHWR